MCPAVLKMERIKGKAGHILHPLYAFTLHVLYKVHTLVMTLGSIISTVTRLQAG